MLHSETTHVDGHASLLLGGAHPHLVEASQVTEDKGDVRQHLRLRQPHEGTVQGRWRAEVACTHNQVGQAAGGSINLVYILGNLRGPACEMTEGAASCTCPC